MTAIEVGDLWVSPISCEAQVAYLVDVVEGDEFPSAADWVYFSYGPREPLVRMDYGAFTEEFTKVGPLLPLAFPFQPDAIFYIQTRDKAEAMFEGTLEQYGDNFGYVEDVPTMVTVCRMDDLMLFVELT